MREKCRTCLAFYDTGSKGSGQCRRRSPQVYFDPEIHDVGGSWDNAWPEVSSDAWCMDHILDPEREDEPPRVD